MGDHGLSASLLVGEEQLLPIITILSSALLQDLQAYAVPIMSSPLLWAPCRPFSELRLKIHLEIICVEPAQSLIISGCCIINPSALHIIVSASTSKELPLSKTSKELSKKLENIKEKALYLAAGFSILIVWQPQRVDHLTAD